MSDNKRLWFITGVSSGFGRALAQAALARGETVVGTLRRKDQVEAFRALAPNRSFAYELDVTHQTAIGAVVERAAAEVGPPEVLVNNAGYGLFGAVEEVSDQEARRVLETNFFGVLTLTRSILPLMRARRKGHIVNFSSVAGFSGIPGCALYCASKFAVEGLSEAMAAEVAPFGIKVTLVEPGGFRTDFAGGSKIMAANTLVDYAETPAAKTRQLISQYGGHEPGDPDKAAQAILKVVDAPTPPLRLVLGADALGWARGKLQALLKDYDSWEQVSCSTNLTGNS